MYFKCAGRKFCESFDGIVMVGVVALDGLADRFTYDASFDDETLSPPSLDLLKRIIVFKHTSGFS